MSITADTALFDPTPYRPTLALIRMPRDPATAGAAPDPKDEFGTGFFVTTNGILLTAGHVLEQLNRRRTSYRKRRVLPWVWVCCYSAAADDWTDVHRVAVDPALVDFKLDAAILKVPGVVVRTAVPVAADWERGDNVAVLGFQPDTGMASGFDLPWLICTIPRNFPVAPADMDHAREPALRLGFVDPDQQALGEGMSGGLVLNLSCDGSPAIAIQKAVREAVQLRVPLVLTTAIAWLRERLDALPGARDVTWLPRREAGMDDAPPGPPVSDRKAEQSLRAHIVRNHARLRVPGLDRELDLEQIFIALRVGRYVSPEARPGEGSRRAPPAEPPAGSVVIDAVEAISREPHRLLVLGEPGSGKTTLLKYVALRIARRDRAFAAWARRIVASRRAAALDRVQRGLISAGEKTPLAGLGVGVLALIVWAVGIFFSSSRVWAGGAWLVLFCTLFLVLIRFSRRAVVISTVIGVLVLAGSLRFAVVRWYAIAAVAIAFVVLLWPYLIAGPVAWLKRLRDRWTRYPLPLYLTLNDVGRRGEALEIPLARVLGAAGFRDPDAFLRRTLDAGAGLVLLDALDEVMDEARYRWMEDEIAAFAHRHEGTPVVVTCRSAGFRDERTALPGFRRVEVQAFADAEVQRFVCAWFGELPGASHGLAVDLLRALSANPRMRQLAANPLLLSFICHTYEHDLALPNRRVELYQQCTAKLLGTIDDDRRLAGLPASPVEQAQVLEDKRHVLRRMARRFHEQGVRVFDEAPLLEAIEDALGDLGPGAGRTGRGLVGQRREDVLGSLMARSGLIRRQSRTSYGFAHLTWQEYFTADDWHRRGSVDALLTHAADPWWREVVLLYAGQHADATAVVERLTAQDLLLGATALADATDPGTPAFAALRTSILDRLKETMRDTEPARRQDAADVLAALGRWGGTEFLVGCARRGFSPADPVDRGPAVSNHSEVALAAVLALDRAGDRVALEGLCTPLGPMLQVLAGHLGKAAGAEERILALLARLGLPLVAVPAGPFRMGSDEFADSRPVRPVELSGFWIGKYAVTNALYRRFCAETSRVGAPAGGLDDHPVVNVSWRDAVAFCRWAGVELPSEAEWEKAARGTDGRRYPWGERWETGWCNVGTAGTSPVGTYVGDLSPYGCYDMAGNVTEWTRSEWKPYPYVATDGRESMDEGSSGSRVVRGGSFYYYEDFARAASRHRSDPVNRYDLTGFV